MKIKKLIKKLLCRHEYYEIPGTRHMWNTGSTKIADFECCKCGKRTVFDIFEVPKNKYVFKEYSKGDISDGDHTFNELYYHRMILFATICNDNLDIAWRSLKHEDGTMYPGYFIVGINTPEGTFSYHYKLEHWDVFFRVETLDRAPKWDGHTSKDIERLLSLF